MPRHSLAVKVAACLLPLVLTACGRAAADDPRTDVPVVRTAIVRDARPDARSFTGVVAARVHSDLGFRISGKVLERLVDVGESVHRGQLLMRMDASDLKLGADAQGEAVDAARARVRQAREQADHLRDLRDGGTVSDSEYDEAKAAEKAAKAELDAAKDQASIADNTSDYAELRAESDGVVVATSAEPGQVVSAGQTVIEIAEDGPREAEIQLPETLRPALGSTARARLFGDHGGAATATLRQLAGSADQVTRTFDARYVLKGALADAPLGSTVTIEIASREGAPSGALQVPIGAVLDAGQGTGVWVVDGTPPKAAWRPVTVQRVDDESAFVSGQVTPGERVVSMGAHLIRQGERVRVDSPNDLAENAR